MKKSNNLIQNACEKVPDLVTYTKKATFHGTLGQKPKHTHQL